MAGKATLFRLPLSTCTELAESVMAATPCPQSCEASWCECTDEMRDTRMLVYQLSKPVRHGYAPKILDMPRKRLKILALRAGQNGWSARYVHRTLTRAVGGNRVPAMLLACMARCAAPEGN